MTQMVVDRVELLATRQGYKMFKFFNRKWQAMILENAYLLEVVWGPGGQVIKEIRRETYR